MSFLYEVTFFDEIEGRLKQNMLSDATACWWPALLSQERGEAGTGSGDKLFILLVVKLTYNSYTRYS